MVKSAAKYVENNGLMRTLPTAINLVFAITVNIKTDDGLINHATCVLKKIQYLEQSTKQMPSILWVYFEDMKIGQQWRYRYKRFYNLEIDKTWTPIFAIDCHFAVLTGKVTWKQFPLRLARASTIHASQGSTFQQICLDMDISDSQGFQKHQHLAKIYLQHAHYVAASWVTSLKGLQIITLNPHLINVNVDVKEHIAYMQKEKNLKLCYTPSYNMPPGLKCVFLNMSSLHKHIANVKANFNICCCRCIFLSRN